jgi:hypothetical protein
MEWQGSHARFFAAFIDMDHTGGIEAFLHSSTSQTRQVANGLSETRGYNETLRTGSLPGVGTFFIRGRELNLHAGFKTIWRTSSLKSATP